MKKRQETTKVFGTEVPTEPSDESVNEEFTPDPMQIDIKPQDLLKPSQYPNPIFWKPPAPVTHQVSYTTEAALIEKSFYYKEMDRMVAEKLLLEQSNGTCLFRPSISQQGKHVLSIVNSFKADPVCHMLFQYAQYGRIKTSGMKEYDSLEDFFNHAMSYSGVELKLLCKSEAAPLPTTSRQHK